MSEPDCFANGVGLGVGIDITIARQVSSWVPIPKSTVDTCTR